MSLYEVWFQTYGLKVIFGFSVAMATAFNILSGDSRVIEHNKFDAILTGRFPVKLLTNKPNLKTITRSHFGGEVISGERQLG